MEWLWSVPLGNPKVQQLLTDVFIRKVTSNFYENCTHVDVVFDSYQKHSVKEGTRKQRRTTLHRIRTVVNSKDTKLPNNWNSFIELDENKSNLATFLCKELEQQVPVNGEEIVVSGGFEDAEKFISTTGLDISYLTAKHEEADTCMLLHAAEATSSGY